MFPTRSGAKRQALRDAVDLKWPRRNEIGRPEGRPKPKLRRALVLVEVPAPAEVATAKPAEVAAAEAAHVPAAGETSPAEATYVAAAKAAHVAKVSAGEMSPAAVEAEAMVEMVPSDEDRTPKAKAVTVIRIGVSIAIVVAGAVVGSVGVVAAVWIASGGGADHSGRSSRPWIVAVVGVPVSVSPNIVVMTHVTTRDVPVNAMRDPRMGGAVVTVSNRRSVPVRVSDRRRISCGKR